MKMRMTAIAAGIYFFLLAFNGLVFASAADSDCSGGVTQIHGDRVWMANPPITF
jgi:hypothetical protein